jgi:hypothetical protein
MADEDIPWMLGGAELEDHPFDLNTQVCHAALHVLRCRM